MTPILEVRRLSHRYISDTCALEDVSFQVEAGEKLAVVGANGAGKSTLLHLLVGLLRPTTGEILVDGIHIEPRNLPAVRRVIGLLVQDPDDQLFLPTVSEDIAFGPRNLGLPPDEVERRVTDALQRVQATHLRHRAPHHLSAGEKRRCALAAVLALHPRILALDEPTTHLDPRARRGLVALLKSLPTTLILVTHDMALAWDLCDRVLVLHKGRPAADGPMKDVAVDAARMEAWGLEVPCQARDGSPTASPPPPARA